MHDRYRNGAYGEAHPRWHEEDAPHKAEGIASIIRFGGLAPEVVIDVGCGSGAVLRHLRDQFATEFPSTHWEGWDVAGDAIARARKHEGGNLHYVEGDLMDSERSADLLLCIDVVEHVADELAFLEALRGRGRHFVFRFPLDLSVLDVLRPQPRLLQVGPQLGHVHLYTRELALQRLDQAGYRVIDARYHRIAPPRRGWSSRVREQLFRPFPHGTVRWLGGYSLLVLAEPGGGKT